MKTVITLFLVIQLFSLFYAEYHISKFANFTNQITTRVNAINNEVKKFEKKVKKLEEKVKKIKAPKAPKFKIEKKITV